MRAATTRRSVASSPGSSATASRPPAGPSTWRPATPDATQPTPRSSPNAAGVVGLLTAAVAEHHGAVVLHYDADFELIG
jgi:hypothetical protein